MTTDEQYMHRCLQLAKLARGDVAPNPMVGAVLVHQGRIIGEGYHQVYGKAHAEVACLESVKEEDQHLVPQSTLYVSLEPCAHFGKTPPCADLVIAKKIPKVVIGCRDPFVEVNGKGIDKLQAAGVQVELGVLENACRDLNKRFFTFHTKQRPYIILKWAQSADGRIAGSGSQRVLISNDYTARVVHKWRSEEAAILVGTNTALHDDPSLSTRHWPGKNPLRLVVDMDLRLPTSLQLFNQQLPTIVFNKHRHTLPLEKMDPRFWMKIGLAYYQLTGEASLVRQLVQALYGLGIQSVLVEGGATLLQSFIDAALWDEARVITNQHLSLGAGLSSPRINGGTIVGTESIFSDTVTTYHPVTG